MDHEMDGLNMKYPEGVGTLANYSKCRTIPDLQKNTEWCGFGLFGWKYGQGISKRTEKPKAQQKGA